MNAHIRGVLHVMTPEAIRGAIANIRDMLGDKGSLYVVETDFDWGRARSPRVPGGVGGRDPGPLRLCIASRVRPPMHFSEKEMDDSSRGAPGRG